MMRDDGRTAHLREPADVLHELQVDPHTGLNTDAVDMSRRLHGTNEIPPPSPTPFFKLVLKQFQDTLVLILCGAMVISFVLGFFEDGENRIAAFVEPFVILLILAANATVGVVQETNAENAIASLKLMEAPVAKVLREGSVVSIPASQVVPGDIVHVSAGDKVPADLRVIEITSSTLQTDESSLTGESESVYKQVGKVEGANLVDQDKSNILFSSTLVTRGHGIGVAVLTGVNTSIGRIQQGLMRNDDDEELKTPLQEQLDRFGETLSKLILGICVFVWLINIVHFTDPQYGGFLKGAIYYFKIAVALAVAAIPEGLPAVVTTCLAIGTMHMARRNAIVRSLPSVETLGCTSVICADKTGTLTTNEMTVCKLFTISEAGAAEKYDVRGLGLDFRAGGIERERSVSIGEWKGTVLVPSNPSLTAITKISALCNDAHINKDPVTGTISKTGDGTEVALKVLAEKLKPTTGTRTVCDTLTAAHPRIHLLEFDRERKSMGVIVNRGEGEKGGDLLVKGAPESLIGRCSNVLLSDGSVKPFTKQFRNVVLDTLHEYERDRMRCISFAYSEAVSVPAKLLKDPGSFAEIESQLTFVGVAGLVDPIRPQVADAIRLCSNAGIRVIVITGDSLETATSICRQLGILPLQSVPALAITGGEFAALDPINRLQCAENVRLFARVEPSHKKLLVELLQKRGHIVAMTGDGINDAPALRQADIGIAMGSGTAVAREASNMVLQDNSFSTLVMAVEQGRAIYANCKAFIRYLISSNIGEVACIFLTAALGIPEVLVPIQLLWVNLVTDGLPATALSFNPPDPDLMHRQPRSRSSSMVTRWLILRYFVVGIYVGLATVGGFMWWFTISSNGPRVTTFQLMHHHNCSPDLEQWRGVNCQVFADHHGPTVALSILVMVEMFNALNALSENQSLVKVTPASNPWVIIAICLSVFLHLCILYLSWLATIFSVVPLNASEWTAVLCFSAPVLLVEEVFKFLSRGAGDEIMTTFQLYFRRRIRGLARHRSERSHSDTSELQPLRVDA